MFGFLISLVGWIWNGIQAAADYVVIALQYAYYALKAGLGAVWDAARWSYENILKPIGQFLHDAYDRLKTLYNKILRPILDWSKRITDTLRRVYATFIQPVLSAIDGARRILQLLELLHVAWAKALDDALANLEHKISQPLIIAIQTINAIDSRIESYILTADNLFRRATLIGSIERDLSSVANMGWNRSLSTITDEQRQGSTGMDDYAPVDSHVDLFANIAAGDDAAAGIDVETALALGLAFSNGDEFSMWTGAEKHA